MIAFLRGKVAAVESEAAVIDVGGVGYMVNVTARCAAGLRGNREEVQLHTHMIIREDDIQLYGFDTPGEITSFMLLLSVNGVGPKAALAVLSSLTPRGLGRALALEDTGTLTRVPGVGKKIAQRIILELKDKLGKLETGLEITVSHASGVNEVPDDAISALMALGYSGGEAREAVRKAFSECNTSDVQQLIKSALRFLDQNK